MRIGSIDQFAVVVVVVLKTYTVKPDTCCLEYFAYVYFWKFCGEELAWEVSSVTLAC